MPNTLNTPNTTARVDPTQRQATGQLGQRRTRFQATPDEFRQDTGGGPGFAETLLGGLAGLGSDIAKMKFIDKTEELYVQGQRSRYQGKSWEDVERNALTAPFLRGGFQDQDLRMRMQALNSEASTYIKQQGRKLDPDSFQKWYQPKADAVLEAVGKGLSREARASVITNLMKQEALIAEQHNKAYQDYILEHTGQVLSTEVRGLIVQAQELKAAGADMTPVMERTSALLEGIWTTEFDLDTQEEFISKVLESLFEADITEFSALVDPASPQFALEGLRMDSLSKINKAKSAALERTKFRRNAEVHVKMHELLERQKAGNPISPAEVQELIELLADTEYGNAQWLQRIMALKDAAATDTKRLGAEYWSQRNLAGLNELGMTEKQGADAYGKLVMQQFPDQPAAAMRNMMVLAQENGTIPQAYVDLTTSALRAYAKSADGAVLPQHAAVIQQFSDDLLVLRETDSISLGELQRNLPEEFAGVITTMLDKPAGMDVLEALNISVSINAEQVLQATKGRHAYDLQEIRGFVADSESHGKLIGLAKGIGRLTGLAPETIMNSDEAMRSIQMAITDEMERLQRIPSNATLSLEMLYNTASANVRKTAIPVGMYGGEVSMLHLPGNYLEELSSTARAAGLYAESIGAGEVREALEEVLSSTVQDNPELQAYLKKGGARVFVQGGEVYAQWIPDDPEDGMPSDVLHITKQDLAINIAGRRQEQLDYSWAAETGGTYAVRAINMPGTPRVQVTVHGQNSSGVPTPMVLDLRQQLLDREAFSPKPYKDGQGESIGFGRNFTGRTRPPAEVSVEEATAWFIEDTDKAIAEARKIASEYGITGVNTQLALAGMVYQLGPEGTREFSRMLQSLKDGDFNGMFHEVITSRWYRQTPDRVRDFIDRVNRDFKE